MLKPRRVLTTAGVLAAIALLAAGVPREHASDASAGRGFVLGLDFPTVSRVLRHPETAGAIRDSAGTTEFVSFEWDDTDVDFKGFELGADGPRLDLSLTRTGTLRVRILNDELGRDVITLGQEVELGPAFITSQVRLREGTDRLKAYELDARFEPTDDGGETRVTLALRQQVLSSVPPVFRGVADRRVREAAAETLAAQEMAIRTVVARVAATLPEPPPVGQHGGGLQQLLRGLLGR